MECTNSLGKSKYYLTETGLNSFCNSRKTTNFLKICYTWRVYSQEKKKKRKVYSLIFEEFLFLIEILMVFNKILFKPQNSHYTVNIFHIFICNA